jgi:superfamily II DNA or RNA helicase
MEGTKVVDKFFNDSRPYTYEFSMETALDKGYLCKYYYYPYLVELTEEELKGYIEISAQLAKFIHSTDTEISAKAEKLLLLRKQIIHKANNKILQFDKLILELSKQNRLKHTLVYAPEGYFGEFFNDSESLENLNIEENRICEFYSSRIRSLSPQTKVALFNAGTQSRDFILNQFSRSEIDVLVSMKCLDEGVDVPRTEMAVFCASTGNPRQFIQRRGRILRNHKEKQFAYIYDLVVVPSLSQRVGNFQVEKRLIENELRRVNEFADLAENRFEALERVKYIVKMYDIDQPI